MRTRLLLFLIFLLPVLSARAEWQKNSSPHATIYTADSVSAAKDWAVAIEEFKAGLHGWFETGAQAEEPMIIVIFESNSTYSKFVGAPVTDRQGLSDTSRATFFNGRFLTAINGGQREK